MIFNLSIIIKSRTERKYALMLDDFALEPSENFNSIFLRIYFADSIGFKLVKLGPFSSDSNKSYIIFRSFNIEMWNVLKICSLWLILPAQVIITWIIQFKKKIFSNIVLLTNFTTNFTHRNYIGNDDQPLTHAPKKILVSVTNPCLS